MEYTFKIIFEDRKHPPVRDSIAESLSEIMQSFMGMSEKISLHEQERELTLISETILPPAEIEIIRRGLEGFAQREFPELKAEVQFRPPSQKEAHS
jgi:hypothetical protein